MRIRRSSPMRMEPPSTRLRVGRNDLGWLSWLLQSRSMRLSAEVSSASVAISRLSNDVFRRTAMTTYVKSPSRTPTTRPAATATGVGQPKSSRNE
jgi:hypothetical protein